MPNDSIETFTAGKKPTLRTVAEMTGFAVTTVSRALADDPRIAEATRAAVAAAAREVGYVPDRAARRLRTGRTKVISLFVNPSHEFLGFSDELIGGLISALDGTDYSVVITPDYVDADRVKTAETILRNRLADGVIFSRTETFDPRVRLLLEHDFPFVCHGRTEFATPHPFVDFDNEAFAREGVARMVAAGRKRLSMILPEPRFTFTQHLRYGFVSAAREAGIDFEIEDSVTVDSDPQDMTAAIRARREDAAPPDGYVCVGEVAALATLAALHDSGATLGVDADMLAKRASPVFRLMRPHIPTVFEDVRKTGECLGRTLLRRMEGAPMDELQTVIPPLPDA